MKNQIILFMMVFCVSTASVTYGYTVSDYDWYSYNGHQYTLTMEHSNWANAEAEAIAVGGHLVTVNDMEEQNWLIDTSSNPFGDQYCRDYQGVDTHNIIWIGLEHVDGDKMLSSSWGWQNEEPVTFWNIDSYLYIYDNGIHMYMEGPHHPSLHKQWNCEVYEDTVPSRYLRGVIEVVPEPCSLLLMSIGCGSLFLRKRK